MGILETTRKITKVAFCLLQMAILFSGIFLLFMTILLYLKSNSLIDISPSLLFTILFTCLLLVLNSYLGLICLSSDNKSLLYLFVFTMTTIMNIQMIFAIRSDNIVLKKDQWINKKWNSYTDTQKKFVEAEFKCCGLETTNDRSTKGCKFLTPCSAVFESISRTLLYYIHISLFYTFLIESLSLTSLSFLKFIK